MCHRDGSACLRSVECYDPHTNKWSSVANMCRRRGGVAVGVLNGFLYAVGESWTTKQQTEKLVKSWRVVQQIQLILLSQDVIIQLCSFFKVAMMPQR